MVDTVENAQTPAAQQPRRARSRQEYDEIRSVLGRRPTSAELAMYSVMWSEHCSYKSSKLHLKRFAVLGKQTPRGPLLAGMGDNAGVVDIGQGYAITFKMESHNHPSYVEPYQGCHRRRRHRARHVAGAPDRRDGRPAGRQRPDTARVLPGIVAGVVAAAAWGFVPVARPASTPATRTPGERCRSA